MTRYLVRNRRTKATWTATAEEALFYCSRITGIQEHYLVMDAATGNLVLPIELLSNIYKARRAQRIKNA